MPHIAAHSVVEAIQTVLDDFQLCFQIIDFRCTKSWFTIAGWFGCQEW